MLKQLFKNSIVFLVVIIATSTNAQTKIYFGLDPKMLLSGPGHNYTQKSTLDFEIGITQSVTDKFRVGAQYKQHQAMDFKKITWLAIDYKTNLINAVFDTDRFSEFAGLDWSTIYRQNLSQHYQQIIYPDDQSQFFRFGVRAELQFKIDAFWSVYTKYTGYQGEELLGKYNKYRHEGTIGFVFNLTEALNF